METTLTEIAEQVFLKRPVLKDILSKHGTETLLEYSKQFAKTSTVILESRKSEFIQELAAEAARVLGADAGERIKRQLQKNYFVSTADHLGPLSHPFFAHTNMLAGLSQGLTDWIVLACSNVSLGNSSFPRGMQFHFKKNEALGLLSVPFFPSRLRQAPVYNLPGYKTDAIKKIREQLQLGCIENDAADAAINIFGSEDVLNLNSYDDQIILTNSRLFKALFLKKASLANLVYLNQERLTVKLLEHHFSTQTEIHSLLFEPECREQVMNLFQGLPGAFSLQEKKGSFLFWGYNAENKKRIRLTEDNGYLKSDDGIFKIRIQPAEIQEALQTGRLIPSMLLNMLVVGGYYGVKCLGGFSQTSYLTGMLQTYKKMFPAAVVGESQTLCGDFIFADIVSGGVAAAATGLDVLLYNKQFDALAFEKLCGQKTLNEVMDRVLPILYKILYPNERGYSWPLSSYKEDFSIDTGHAFPVIKL